MSPEAMFNFHSGLMLVLCGLFSLVVPFGWAQHRSNKGDEFSCPEEFGYYAHPTDCTQYYVCVFGGPILESCTGGLMYSHDLQTCDWPRNVGCGASASPSAAINNANGVSGVPGTEELVRNRQTTSSWKHEGLQPQDEIPDRHLYEEEDLGAVEEIESDRQQRVYRGQPPTLGQVARDRDGIIRHVNALQTSSGPEKVKPVAVLSFSPHHQSLREGNLTDVVIYSSPANIDNANKPEQLQQPQQPQQQQQQTNRVRRDIVSRSDPRFNETVKSEGGVKNGGYALHYRPVDVANVNSSSVTIDLLPTATATSINTMPDRNVMSNVHSSHLSPQVHVLFSTTSPKPFTPAPGNKVSFQRRPFAATSSRPSSNPAQSASNNMHTFTEVEDSPLVVSDFSYVSIAPKSQPHSPIPRLRRPVNYESHATDFQPQYYPHPFSQPAAVSSPHPLLHQTAVSSHNFYNGHYFNRIPMHPYYGAVGLPPPFYPPIHPAYQHYTAPETSIVTLTYPSTEHSSSNSEQTSTTEPPAVSQVTHASSASEKLTEASSSVNQTNTEANKNYKRKVPKDEFESEDDEDDKDEDEQVVEEPVDEEQGNDDFENESQETVTTSSAHQNETLTKKNHEEGTNSADEEINDHDDVDEDPAESEDQQEEAAEEHDDDNGESDIELLIDENNDGKEKTQDEVMSQEPRAHVQPQSPAKARGHMQRNQPQDLKKKSLQLPVSFSSFYRQYLTDKQETPFSDVDFDLMGSQSRLFSPTIIPTNKSELIRVKKANYGYHHTFPLAQSPSNEYPTFNHSSNQTALTRKNDNILTLQIYDELPRVLVKSPRAAKPTVVSSKRVIPLALVHTYKPANYSYQNHYRLQPSIRLNSFDRGEKSNNPINLKTGYFPEYLNSQFSPYSFQAPQFGFHNISNDEVADCEGSECEEYTDEREEEEPQNNEQTGDAKGDGKDNEYYDDYADDYSNNDHLKEPLTKPVIPNPPSRIRNIDFDVTAPPIKGEEEEVQDDGETKGEGEVDEESEGEANPNNEQQEEKEEQVQEGEEERPEEEEEVPDHENIEESSVNLQKLKKPLKQAAAVHQHTTQHHPNKFMKGMANKASKYTSQQNRLTSNIASTTTMLPNFTQKKMTIRDKTPSPSIKLKQDMEKFKQRTIPKPNINLRMTPSYTFIKTTVIPSITPYSDFTLPNGSYNIKNKQKQVDVEQQQINYQETNTKPAQPQKTISHWTPSQGSSFIIQQSVSPLPATTKAIYNVTKFEPYYSVYDDDPEVYRDVDYSQYQNQKKVPSTYQVVQKPQHRLQPQLQQPQPQPQPQIINNAAPTGSYTNQDYHYHSNIDDDSQQSEKQGTTRFLLDDPLWKALSTAPSNDRPVTFLVSNPSTHKISNPSVVGRPDDNRHLKITSFFQVANLSHLDDQDNAKDNLSGGILAFGTERTYQTLPRLDPFETGHSPKITPYSRNKAVTQTTSSTNLIKAILKTRTAPATSTTASTITTTATSKPTTKLKFPPRDANDFRIIVEPVAAYKRLAAPADSTNSHSTPVPTKVTSAVSPLKSSPSALLLSAKFSSSQYRSQPSNFTYTPYTMITTTTKPSTLSLTNSSDSEKFRRFYIPRTDIVERKPLVLNIPSTSSTVSVPHKTDTMVSFLTPTTRPSSTIRKVSTTANAILSEYYEDEISARNSKAVNTSANDTLKLYDDNDISYYDEYYYDDDEDDDEAPAGGDKTNDNYIDNKISEYTTPSNTNDLTLRKSTKPSAKSNPSTKNVVLTSTTATHIPKSSSAPHKPTPLLVDHESSTIASSTKSFHRVKDSNAQRCPQCNEKPYVRGRNRGSITYTTGGNEYDSVTSTAGSSRARPTLKPSTSIVSKSEGIDIYKNAPKRPDPVYPTPQVDKAAAKCRKDICLLPDCSCGGKDIPGDLRVEETPQIVLLTFDDSVNELNKGLYSDLFDKGRVNPNGCPISATFYVSHEWTDYSMVQNLYAAGHEIASHSVSHSFGEQFSQRKWTKEIVGQREILSAYGGVRQDDIRGMRAPFLAVGGNKMFKMLYDANFTYDSSMPIYENRPPSWPYTMDYKLFHDCMIPPCPTRSYPGIWEVPMVMWQDLNGGRCSMGDACSNPPTADGVYKMLIKNFERHFTTNRAPFGLFYHSSFFTQPQHKEGFIAFLDTIVNMPEVWLVTNWQAIQWARDPTPISRLNQFTPFGCDYPERPKRCNNPKVCNLWHKSGVRYLKTCQPCPDVYPWTGKTGVKNSRVDNDDTLTE